MKKFHRIHKGFTLVELIVVVAVLALLAVSAVIAIRGMQRNARMTSYRADAIRLSDALNVYNSLVRASEVIQDSVGVTAVSTGTGDSVSLVIVADSSATIEDINIQMVFSSIERFNEVLSFVFFDSASAGGGGIWRVDEAAIVAAF
jgi:prepilin-type N-terminal cleavage/methylation domain-containing protein